MRLPLSLAAAVRRAVVLAGVAGAALACAPASHAADAFTAQQKAGVEKIVHDYLIANPEVIREAIDELKKKEDAAEVAMREKAVTELGDKISRSPNQAVVGNPNGDVTLVEFFDYNCGYCKQSLANVAKLVETDPKLRVVLKDFAVLGADSVETAEVATAVREQFKGQKFWEFHRKLLSTRGHIGKTQALAVAKELGADMNKLEKDLGNPAIMAGLKEVGALADALQFTGTPSWVIGNEGVVGGLPLAELKSKIDNMRKCGAAAC